MSDRENRQFKPLIDRVNTPWGKAGIVAVALLLIIVWTFVSDKAFGAERAQETTAVVQTTPTSSDPDPGPLTVQEQELTRQMTPRMAMMMPCPDCYDWHLSLSIAPAPMTAYHTMQGVPPGTKKKKAVTGRKICHKGEFATFSKYDGLICAPDHKGEAEHWFIQCSGDIVIGYVFGEKKGAAAGAAACVWHLF